MKAVPAQNAERSGCDGGETSRAEDFTDSWQRSALGGRQFLRRKIEAGVAILSVLALIALVVRSSTGIGGKNRPSMRAHLTPATGNATQAVSANGWLAYGDTLPDFAFPTVAGDTVRRSDLQGQLALIGFLPFSRRALQEAPDRICELVDSCVGDVRIVLFFAADSGTPQLVWHDSSLVQDLIPAAVVPSDVLRKRFRLPQYACSYLALVDSCGVVRLGTSYIDGQTLRTIIRRYR